MRGLFPVVAAVFACALSASAQVAPNESWRTIRTEHFRVHFTPPLEDAARRAAADAERAWLALARELKPPRGTIDLLVTDHADFSNGTATSFPWNRIVIFATPPTASLSLRYYGDWSALVITHELVHVFHLDRARGLWRAGRAIFGRNPLLMPNAFAPAWITEGLATYYESRITGFGRVEGSYHSMIVRSSVLANQLPRPAQWSRATSRFPEGETPYVYGSLFLDYLARTRGPERIGDFVERTSGGIPFTYSRAARRSFGASFNSLWREWRDSLRGEAEAVSDVPLPSWRDLTTAGRLALFPRWLDSGALVFAASTGKDVPHTYRVDTLGRATKLERRNSVDRNVPLSSGGLLFAQLEYVSLYHLRSDLWIEHDGRARRLTRGARLGEPDARADGAIVAVRGVPATNQLVRVSADGATVTPLTAATPDTQWSEPRWSPNGDRISAMRWTRGGYADVVVLDTLGAVLAEVTRDRAVDASPAWSRDGRWLFFASDRSGVTDVYAVAADSLERSADANAGRIRRLSRAATGLFQPEPAPIGGRLAALLYRIDGWHIGLGLADPGGAPVADPPRAPRREPATDTIARAGGMVERYSPWSSLLPRYWLPSIGNGSRGSTSFGGLTSGADVIGRHEYLAEAMWAPTEREGAAYVAYRYAGFGLPLIDLGVEQDWDRFFLRSGGSLVGDLIRRRRVAGVGATLVRQRARTAAAFTVGGQLEHQRFSTDPDTLLPRVAFVSGPTPRFRVLFTSASFSNARRPAFSISPEDGISAGVLARQRWREESPSIESREFRGALAGYKSLGGGGFAHHVLALRVAGAGSTGRAPEFFSVGGAGGEALEIVPGFVTGGRLSFGVRGYPRTTLEGTHVGAGSLEYRFPFALTSRGPGIVLLDRLSGALFADGGAVFRPGPRDWVASVGAELSLDIAWLYDIPYRLRAGAAAPLRKVPGIDVPAAALYVRLGTSF